LWRRLDHIAGGDAQKREARVALDIDRVEALKALRADVERRKTEASDG